MSLVIFMTFGGLFLIGYIVYFFLIKNIKAYRIMSFFSSSTVIFFAASTIMNLLVYDDRWSFNVDNTSLFISSSFTLLG